MAKERGQDVSTNVPSDIQDWLREHRLARHIKWPTTPPVTKNDPHFDPEHDDVKHHYVRVPVESLADLKAWIGIPNAKQPLDEKGHPAQATHDSSRQPAPIVTGSTGDDTVRAAEFHVLREEVDDRMLGDAFWGGIIRELLGRWREVPMLVIPSLVVPDGTTARFSNTPTALFDTVTVYGTGSLRFLTSTKLICRTFELRPGKRQPGQTGGITANTSI
jgi:hypothetical protein